MIKCSNVCLPPNNGSVSKDVSREENSSQSEVKHLRWDHANLALYREITNASLHKILCDLFVLDNCTVVMLETVNHLYSRIVDALCSASDLAVPSCRKNFFKFWWDHSLDDLKQKSIDSCNMWKDAGRPRSGHIHCGA